MLVLPDGRVMEGVREVNAALLELLVLDYQQFKKISMIAQGEFAKFLSASPREKNRDFPGNFGTGVYERFTQDGWGCVPEGCTGPLWSRKASWMKTSVCLRILWKGIFWPEETSKELEHLTQTQERNYEVIRECLQKMEALAGENAAFCPKRV